MKRTYQPKKRKRAKTHGFRKRLKSAGGRRTLKRRRQKGCYSLSVTDRNVKRKRKHRSKVR